MSAPMRAALALLFPLATAALAGCSDSRRYAHAVSVLVDVSGTYADQKELVVGIIKTGVLPGLVPGDTINLIRIDGDSYENANVEAVMTLDLRPSHANAQKLAFARELDRFVAAEETAAFTDVQGAMMLAADHLRETHAGTQTIVAFSDLMEDLPPGYRRTMEEGELQGMRVVAVNVKQLRGDNSDPGAYRSRLAAWERRVRESGAADWKVVVDGAKLAEYVEERS